MSLSGLIELMSTHEYREQMRVLLGTLQSRLAHLSPEQLAELWQVLFPNESLLIRPRHTSTTLCGRCVAEVWRGCGPTLGTLW